jgi:hypothetical protein
MTWFFTKTIKPMIISGVDYGGDLRALEAINA